MRFGERRESAQIIQFPLNRRFEARPQGSDAIDPRVAAALDPAWYHLEALADPAPTPKH